MQGYDESFTEEQLKILERYVTSAKGNIFVLRNLPEVIKGALFSRYSRSTLGLRSLLLKEFVLGEGTAFFDIAGTPGGLDAQVIAIKKAQNFYDRILDGYGDDSIGELGGAHVAIENISMLAAKAIEDSRVGGSPLEKSTRYIYFDQKFGGEYLYYREPILMTSAFRQDYLKVCNHLFETYSLLISPLTDQMEATYPRSQEVSKTAYNASIRAKVLDCLRGLLPASALTNMGVFGNGRFWEGLCHKLQCQNMAELQEVGAGVYQELCKEIPSFVRRADPGHYQHDMFLQFYGSLREQLNTISKEMSRQTDLQAPHIGARLIHCDSKAAIKVAAALLFPYTQSSLEELEQYCASLSPEGLAKIFDSASSMRENRRHKSPRALEHANFTFEVVADFGVYRDLQRHRLLTQERQLLTTNYGYFIPQEILGTEMEYPYRQAMDLAEEHYLKISKEFPEEAQYIIPMAFNIRWYFHVNLRSLQWISELRSSPQGHPSYRLIAQQFAQQVCGAEPLFECFFKYVNYDGCDLGRLAQEQRKAEKQGL